MIVVAGVPRRGGKTWMGTHPTKRLFFRRLAVEKGGEVAPGRADTAAMVLYT